MIPYNNQRVSIFYPANKGGTFDNSSSFDLRFTSNIDDSISSKGFFSAWIKLKTSGTAIYFKTSSTNPAINKDIIFSRSSDNDLIFSVGSISQQAVGTYTAANYPDWIHILASWQTNPSKILYFYINDTQIDNETSTGSSFVIAYSIMDINTISSNTTDNSSFTYYLSDISELIFDNTTFLDLTDTSIRRKFISPSRRPVFVGTDGSKITGTQPLTYLKGEGANFHINSGSSGHDYSRTGTPGTPSNSPST